ncbi:hypothetical protein [Actinomycetospora straminea]|uniref:Enoyl-ACP reductase-like protein n=1 Tax=Actinomycetospora straminea TaxID=663607 RepID=A0ABP9EHJ9_9PSEU|nr:hypothetical protein [Actinomycetospora straminea]MDD7933784.1 hypothetical protein [Actinomycetospora straminea]
MSAPTVEAVVRGHGAATRLVTDALAVARPTSPSAVVVPAVPDLRPLDELTDERLATDVGDTLDAVLADVRAVLDGAVHRLVFVLPAAPLMATAGGAAASAVTGGVLSMARTLAIELAREQVAVNVVAVDPRATTVAALAGQLGVLLGEGGEAITGQEIYLTAGTDLGRIRP